MKAYNSSLKWAFLISAFLFNTDSFNYSGKDISTSEMTYSPINITLDPGHTNETNFAKFPARQGRKDFDMDNDGCIEEYELNSIVADSLETRLKKDPLINYVRTKIDGKYTKAFLECLIKNDSLITEMATRERLPNEPRAYLPVHLGKKVYNIGVFAENNSDLLLSLHFNKASWSNNYKGFHVIISPNNEKYKESLELAKIISRTFREKGYKISECIPTDPLTETPDSLLKEGIVRRNLAVLGDPGHKLTKPAVLIECGWLKDYINASDKEIKELSDAVYYSIQEYVIMNNFDGNLYK